MSWCRSCGREIRWVRTYRGVAMPLDPAPVDDGNVVFLANGSVRVISAEDRAKYPGPVYKSHFATCPNAAEHRREQHS